LFHGNTNGYTSLHFQICSKTLSVPFTGLISCTVRSAHSAILQFIIVLLSVRPAIATHIRSADILVKPVCGDPKLVSVTIRAYLNTLSNTKFGTNSRIYFGDGNEFVIPVTEAVLRPELGKNIAVAEITRQHRYNQFGTYTITYIERDRSGNIVNIANSEDTPYVTSVQLTIAPNLSCNRLPVITVSPLDKACSKVAFLHNPGAYDADGDSISYQIAVPAAGLTQLAVYTSPADPRFYTNYNQANEDGTGPPTFGIDPVTGLLLWDAPGLLGEYNVSFRILEWRLDSVSGVWSQISATTRDMQIVVEDCYNGRPDLTVPPDRCVVAGTPVAQTILAFDPENHPVKVELFSELFQLPSGQFPAVYNPAPAGFRPSSPPSKTDFLWQTDLIHVRSQPYQVVAKVTDDPPNAPKLTNFLSWRIKVVAQAPVQKTPLYDVVRRHAVIKWDPYPAGPSKIQVFRRVGSLAVTSDICTTGLPKNSGFILIGETSPADSVLRDTNFGLGLSPGATYCYRVVAYFGAPASTYGLPSQEFCVGPIRADAPVITHASVEKTDTTAGQVRVSWRSPFNISKDQFPPPYEIEVYRASGLAGTEGIVKAGRTRDTTFLDAGINTTENIWNYRLVLYSRPSYEPDFVPVDTSAVASTVWLSVVPDKGSITLNWKDSVAWSNVVPARPYHRIYRARDSYRLQDFILLDSVDVTVDGFTYKDTRVSDDGLYNYRVLTRGSYGNPQIRLQENYSEVAGAYPKSNLLPCVPVLLLDVVDCEQYLMEDNCSATVFSNRMKWTVRGLSGCRKDWVAFKVFERSDPENPRLLARLNDTTFVAGGLDSFIGCYGVSMVLKDGRESLLSAVACNDNCPFFALPNVFTPNGDGINDEFSAGFGLVSAGPDAGKIGCPRFVKSVSFRVVNRWGKEVFRRASEGPDLPGWDGTDDQGRPVPPGMYYYYAEVGFMVRDSSRKKTILNGWLQVSR